MVIIVALKTDPARQFYAHRAAQDGWSVRELSNQIDRKAFERTEIASTQVPAAQANVQAMEATVQRIAVELADSELKAPRDGRVQFLIAHPGEIVAAGGRVLQLIDLADVYMTFFLPETVAGRVALGSEVRIVLDAARQFVIPAQVSYVASVAQFTPKTVETRNERQKMVFRVKARIAPELLQKYPEQVKTGLPGMAHLRLDAARSSPLANEVRAPHRAVVEVWHEGKRASHGRRRAGDGRGDAV